MTNELSKFGIILWQELKACALLRVDATALTVIAEKFPKILTHHWHPKDWKDLMQVIISSLSVRKQVLIPSRVK